MAYKLFASLGALWLTSTVVEASQIEYYRSAHCDAQSAAFYLDRYVAIEPLVNDKACHQAPARALALKLVNGIEPSCIVLAYNDYDCSSLVGSIPASSKCLAATKARIGSWRFQCNDTATSEDPIMSASYLPGELKRRGKARAASSSDALDTITTTALATAFDVTIIASSVANEISSAINVSASRDAAAATTSSPSAGAALSSAIVSGITINSNLTAYVTAGTNTSYTTPSMTTATASSTITFTGTTGSDGSAVFHTGGASSPRTAIDELCSLVVLLTTMVALLI